MLPANSRLRRLSQARRSHTVSIVFTTRRPRRLANCNFALTVRKKYTRTTSTVRTQIFSRSILSTTVKCASRTQSKLNLPFILRFSLANCLTHVVSLTLCHALLQTAPKLATTRGVQRTPTGCAEKKHGDNSLATVDTPQCRFHARHVRKKYTT